MDTPTTRSAAPLSDHRIVARGRRDLLGEGPLWSERHRALLWVDIMENRISQVSLDDGRVREWTMPDTVGWVIEGGGAELIAGIGRSICALDLDALDAGEGWDGVRVLASPEEDRAGNRFNDAKADALGRIWAGTMATDADRPTGALYRFDPDGGVRRMDDGYRITNGPALAPGGDVLLHTDTGRDVIYRFVLNDDGSLGPRETWLEFDPSWGHPDGMTFDADGHLWVGCWGTGQVLRLDPAGVPERAIRLPTPNVTSCAFAGEELDRMFVTTARLRATDELAGHLFEVDPGCRGLPTMRYGGGA